MRTDEQAIRGDGLDTAAGKAWAGRIFTVGRISLAVARLTVAVYFGIALAQLFKTY